MTASFERVTAEFGFRAKVYRWWWPWPLILFSPDGILWHKKGEEREYDAGLSETLSEGLAAVLVFQSTIPLMEDRNA